ncbi:helical backbone metal receptor [bacterium]|nr:helical backbone metal receptor [bacterium]
MESRIQIPDSRIAGSKIQDPRSKEKSLSLSPFYFPLSTIWKTIVLLLICVFQISCSDPPLSPSPPLPLDDAPRRIVSLAPSITEVLFKLDLGDRVVGVTRYCDYPPEAEDKPKVGGYFDVNYEMLLSLQPDLVILLAEHQDAIVRLEELGIRTLSVNHSRVEGILEAITTIAGRCGVKEKGEILRLDLETRISEIQKRFLAQSPSRSVVQSNSPSALSLSKGVPASEVSFPRVLVAVGRLMDKGSGGEIFISGRDGFYDDLITLAGGVNAYREETLKFPALSGEGLVRLDPDVILEMVPDLAGEADREFLMDLWRGKKSVRAVQEGRVHILGEDYVVIPGPRFVDLLEDIAEIINVEEGRRKEE